MLDVTDTERFEMRISPELLAAIDAWRRQQPDNPPRATAVTLAGPRNRPNAEIYSAILPIYNENVAWARDEVLCISAAIRVAPESEY